MQRNTTSRGKLELNQKLHEKNWSKKQATKRNTMQCNTTSRGNVELDQKLHEKNWSKNAAHL